MNKIFVIHFLFLVSLSAVEIFASSWSDDFNNAEKISSTSFAVLNGNGQIELDRRYPPVNFSYSPQDSVVLTIDSANHVSEYSAAFPKEQGTLEFWVNGPFSKTEPFGNLFDFWDNKRDHITIRTYGQYNKTCQLFCMDSSTGLYVCALNFDVPDSRWVHMALVWKWPLITIYVNGQSVGSVAISKTAWRPTAQKLLFGSGFPGVIKSVRLLSKVLSSAQIKDDYAAYYAVTGEVKSVAVRPVANLQWDKAEWSAITPASTSLRVFIESESADVWKPVSEVMLPGNTTGFASSPVNLANLTGHAFPVLRMSASLSTADSTKTPLLNSWAISWNSGLAHPRIYLTAAKRAFLQDKINRKVSPYIEFFNEIKNSAAYNAKRVPFKRDDYYILEDAQARTAGNVLPDMAMAYMFTDSIVYWNGLNRWIDSILIYPSWGGNRDLGAGHILYNLAIVYDWLYDSLTPARRVLIQNKLAVHADTLHQAWKNNKSWLQNHNYVNLGALMTVGVALYDVRPEATTWINSAYDNFTNVLPLLSRDGASVEEVPYWEYGCEALLRYFAIEESFLKQDRITGNAWFRNTWFYRFQNSVPGFSRVTNFGDSPDYDWYGPGYMLQYLASKFRNPYAQELAFVVADARVKHRMSSLIDYRNMVWYDETVSRTSLMNQPVRAFLENMGQYTVRTSWADSNSMFFATEAAPPMGYDAYSLIDFDAGSGHQHPDKGHFLLYSKNHRLIIDDGYTYLKRTAGHNVVTFDNGKGQLGGERMWFYGQAYYPYSNPPRFVKIDTTDSYDYLVADLRGAYTANLRVSKYMRHFLIMDRKNILVVDEVSLDSSRQIEWRLNMDTLSSVVSSKQRLIHRTSDKKAGFLLENLSETLPDSVYSGRFTQSDTFHADPEHGYPKDIIHYSSVSQYQMIKKGVSARFDALIRPFADSSVPQPVSFRRTGGDTLVLAVDSITYWVHAPTKTAGIYPSNVFAEDDDLIERSMSLTVSPNPYNPVCRINFYVPMSGKGSLTLYDCRGSKVSELVSGNINRGNHALTLNALSANGKGFASGVYLLRLRTAFGELKQKIILAQ